MAQNNHQTPNEEMSVVASKRQSSNLDEVGYLNFTEDTKEYKEKRARSRKECFEGLNWQLHEQVWKKKEEKKPNEPSKEANILPICLKHSQGLEKSKENIKESLLRQMEEKRALSLIEKRNEMTEKHSFILGSRLSQLRPVKRQNSHDDRLENPVLSEHCKKQSPSSISKAVCQELRRESTPEKADKGSEMKFVLGEFSFGKKEVPRLVIKASHNQNREEPAEWKRPSSPERRRTQIEKEEKIKDKEFMRQFQEELVLRKKEENWEKAQRKEDLAMQLRKQMAEKSERQSRSGKNKENEQPDYFLFIRQKDNVPIKTLLILI